ncbi:MAG: SDR family NAD(P)-dependent oxidoreductase [Planctomycetota bacterium]|jgi:3-oxoacyl-[acyl-carrier protein] reductase
MKLLEGKSAIVTGASLGIGSAIARALAEAGSNVAVNYRKHDAEAKQVAADVEAAGARSLVLQADVSDFARAQEVVEEVRESFGGLDILVCNAGINRDGVIWKMAEDSWDQVIGINLKGYFNYCRAAAPIFKEQKAGKVINITSINGMRGKFGQTNYAASKAGIIGLTKSMAREMGRSQVNVNAVAPGLIETAMVADMPEEAKKVSLAETVFNRLGTPEDVANVVVFLASELSRHVTGEVIRVDGGQYI